MICSLCKRKLSPVTKTYIWQGLQSWKIFGWKIAKMPIHDECIELAENEIAKSKIIKASGNDCIMYFLKEPKYRIETMPDGLEVKIYEV